MIKLVIFDLDGTLYDYEQCNRIAENKLYGMMSEAFELSRGNAESILRTAKQATKHELGNVAASHNRVMYMQKICEILGVNPCIYVLNMYNLYWDSMLANMKLYDYVMPLLRELKNRNIAMSLLTDLTALIQYRKIDMLNIGEYFDLVTTSEEAGEEKPSAKMFQLALNKSGVLSDEALMIGDSYECDILGAEKVGIKALLYKRQENFYNLVLEELGLL